MQTQELIGRDPSWKPEQLRQVADPRPRLGASRRMARHPVFVLGVALGFVVLGLYVVLVGDETGIPVVLTLPLLGAFYIGLASVIAAALLSDGWCGLIADGIHVSAEMLAIALRVAGDRCFLVSDAMPTVGGPDRFSLYGREIAVRDGRLVNAEGALAGAHLDLPQAMRHLLALTGASPGTANAMATDRPRRAMGLAPLAVGPGTALRDLLALDHDLRMVPLPGRGA